MGKPIFIIRNHATDSVTVFADFDEVFKAVSYVAGIHQSLVNGKALQEKLDEYHKWIIKAQEDHNCDVTVYMREVVDTFG